MKIVVTGQAKDDLFREPELCFSPDRGSLSRSGGITSLLSSPGGILAFGMLLARFLVDV